MEKEQAMDRINKSNEAAEQIREETLQYLEDRYDGGFTVRYLESAGLSMGHDRLIVIPDAYPEESFYVNRYVENGQAVYKDNYFTLYMRRDLEQYFEEMAERIKAGTHVRVKLKMSVLPDTMTPASTCEDLISLHGSTELYIYLYHNGIFTEAERQAFLAGLTEKEISASVIFEQEDSGEQRRYMINRDMKLYQF